MPRAETAMRAAAAATISLAPVVGFFSGSVLGVSPAGGDDDGGGMLHYGTVDGSSGIYCIYYL